MKLIAYLQSAQDEAIHVRRRLLAADHSAFTPGAGARHHGDGAGRCLFCGFVGAFFVVRLVL